ncbi:MAG: YlxR family protein [Chloroflexota bacterium]
MPAATGNPQALPARHFPVRTCVACRTERQKREFVRVVRAPDGTVGLDATGKANGRGAYLCADGSCWTVALKKKAIERALSAPLPPELRSHLERGNVPAEANVGGETNGS